MVWNTATPLGTESKSLGDDRIRELKTDIQTALRADAADGTEAIFPGSDTSNPVFRYRGLKGSTIARPTAGEGGLYFNETKNTIERDNGSGWVEVGTYIPSGTVMLFFQAAAPTGWTKVTTQNDKVMRVVSGAGGGAGGSIATSTGLAHTHTVDSHTHTYSGTTSGTAGQITDAGVNAATTAPTHTHTFSGTTAASAPGTDSQLGVLAYIDIIACSKD